MKRYKAYKYRIYPNRTQRELLEKHFGCSRWAYNYALRKCINNYRNWRCIIHFINNELVHADLQRVCLFIMILNCKKKSLTGFDLIKQITQLKKTEEYEWLNEVTADSMSQAVLNLDNAYKKFFKEKKGFPKFKSKKSNLSTQFPSSDGRNKVDFDAGLLKVTKFNKPGIKCKFHREFEGAIKMVTISKTNTEKYFASVLVEEEIEDIPRLPVNRGNAIGIDLGLTSLMVTSNGDVIDNPRHLKKASKRLIREQKRLSRKKKGSNNRIKQRFRVAKRHEKITNQRNYYLHNVTRKLIDDNQVNAYCIEDLNVAGMMKNHCLAKSIADASWGKFVQFLTYKAEWAGKTVIKIGRFEPSSKTCNVCGLVNQNLKLSDRHWVCECGAEHDRDFLAACNIRDFAFEKVGMCKPELETPVENLKVTSVDEAGNTLPEVSIR